MTMVSWRSGCGEGMSPKYAVWRGSVGLRSAAPLLAYAPRWSNTHRIPHHGATEGSAQPGLVNYSDRSSQQLLELRLQPSEVQQRSRGLQCDKQVHGTGGRFVAACGGPKQTHLTRPVCRSGLQDFVTQRVNLLPERHAENVNGT